MIKLKNSDYNEMLSLIIEEFESILDDYNINIPNEEKESDENASNIYGSDYGYLETTIETILTSYGLGREKE